MSQLLRVIQTAGKNEVEEAIIKGTFSDDLPPKEKHVRHMIDWTRDDPQFDFCNFLTARLSESDWQVVFKTLCVIHRISRDGDPNFMNTMRKYSHAMNLGSFLDRSSTDTWGQSRVIRAYSDYLSEKLYIFKCLNTAPERLPQAENKEWVMGLSITGVCEACPMLQKQFEYLLQIKPYVGIGLHPVPYYAFKMLIRDSIRLYAILQLFFFRLLEERTTLTKEQAGNAIAGYKHFAEQNEKYRQWSSQLENLDLVRQEHLPDFEEVHKMLGAYVAKLQGHADGTIHDSGVRNLKDVVGDDVKLVVEKNQPNVEDTKKPKKKKKPSNVPAPASNEHVTPAPTSNPKPVAAATKNNTSSVSTKNNKNNNNSNNNNNNNNNTSANVFGEAFDPFGEPVDPFTADNDNNHVNKSNSFDVFATAPPARANTVSSSKTNNNAPLARTNTAATAANNNSSSRPTPNSAAGLNVAFGDSFDFLTPDNHTTNNNSNNNNSKNNHHGSSDPFDTLLRSSTQTSNFGAMNNTAPSPAYNNTYVANNNYPTHNMNNAYNPVMTSPTGYGAYGANNNYPTHNMNNAYNPYGNYGMYNNNNSAPPNAYNMNNMNNMNMNMNANTHTNTNAFVATRPANITSANHKPAPSPSQNPFDDLGSW